jgi:ABC-2 type transport system permease protein
VIDDVWTVARKELKEIWSTGGGRRGWLNQLIILGVFGIFVPLQAGRAWVEAPLAMLTWAWLPYMLAASTVSDSFAGERERHTLETLLASRLSDRAILFGKTLAVMIYACGNAWVAVVMGLVSVNVVHGGEGLLMYSPLTALGIVLFSLLGCGVAAGAGVLISLRAATVRQAAQTLTLGIFALFLPVFIVQFLPEAARAQFFLALARADVWQVLLVAALLLAALDTGLILAALARFKRSRLILS